MNNRIHAHATKPVFPHRRGIANTLPPKLINAMKLTLFFLLVFSISVTANVVAQKIDLDVKDAPFRSVLSEIQQKSEYSFVIKETYIKQSTPVSITVTGTDVEELLPMLFAKQPFGYQVNGKVISVVPKETPKPLDKPRQNVNIRGRIIDSVGAPLAGANVRISGTTHGVVTDADGRFILSNQAPGSAITITRVGYQTKEVPLSLFITPDVAMPDGVEATVNGGIVDLRITLLLLTNQLAETEVVVNTGYEKISPERMTGSYVTIDNELLNRRISTNILDRIDGVTPGLVFNKTAGNYSGREPAISIRGRSTINANAEPLIILDNFPYDGNMADINPNDVESITVLKDAAAASVWGARSGNGVIVITTKRGQLGQAPKVSVTGNVTVGEKPDLYYSPQLTSAEYIEVEKFLFDQGMFNSRIASPYQAISPAVDIFAKVQNGELAESEGESMLDVLRKNDIREQQLKYLYQPSINQQYNLNVQGGGQYQQYYLSAGYDRNRENAVRNNMERFTLNTNNTFSVFKDRLKLSSQVLFTQTKNFNTPSYSPIYPYAQIADTGGNPLAVIPRDGLKPSFIDTAGGGRLLNWTYYPLREIEQNYTDQNRTDYRINLSGNYNIIPELAASIQYQYGRGINDGTNTFEAESFNVRNLVNSFTQFDPTTGNISRPLPIGEIRRITSSNYRSQYGRLQLNFNKEWNDVHRLAAFAAFEVKDLHAESGVVQLYGYNPNTAVYAAAIDHLTYYPQFPSGSGRRIDNFNSRSFSTDRFRSYIGNASYTFKHRYTVFGSIRRDESNLFGVSTNQKGVPLWSIGGSWNADKEAFFRTSWLPMLKVRSSFGRQGNIDRSISAYLTAVNYSFANSFGDLYADILNPPNPSLRWEKVDVWNIGLDFALRGNLVAGSIDVFRKNAKDLIGNSPLAPQTGLVSFRGNTANMITRGLDLNLKGNWLSSAFKWTTDFLYSYAKDKITSYKTPQSTNLDYMRNNYLNPFEGKPYSALFSFPFAGLDTQGNPQGYLNGEISTDYSALTSLSGEEYMVYHGSQVPTSFGSIRNTFSYRSFTLSFNITYKLGYFFRRVSLNNSALYTDPPLYQAADFRNRWKNPGDELTTTIPALVYPAMGQRQNFYEYSEALIEKADHVRLQDIRLEYELNRRTFKALPIHVIRFYCYLNNIGILWRANEKGIDPDVFQVGSYPVPRTVSFGLTANF
jgi:TonB-dependent starch-binding outer membrane protein SusC